MKTTEKIKDFFALIDEKQLRMIDFFDKIVENRNLGRIFRFGLVTNEKISIYENGKLQEIGTINWREGSDFEESECINETLRSIYCVEETSASFCGIFSMEIDEHENVFAVYYWAALKYFGELNPIYLNIANEIYRKWISKKYYGNWQFDHDEEIAELCFETFKKFHKKIKNQLEIDLDIINEIAGAPYEKDPCHAVLCFCASNKELDYLVTFMEPVHLREDNVQLVRKKLRMVQSGQCLVASRKKEYSGNSSGWEISGIAKEECIKGQMIAVFRIRNHLEWVVEIDGKTAVCYKGSHYFIEHDIFKIKEFAECFETVFHCACTEEVQNIIRAAIRQNHGSALIFMDKVQLENLSGESKVKACMKSVGFVGGTQTALTKEQLSCFSAIDGTMLLDKFGVCLRYGMMLNSPESEHGRRERGSRFNSVDNYIENCKKENIDAIGVVVSDDEIVNIMGTAHKEIGNHGGERNAEQ